MKGGIQKQTVSKKYLFTEEEMMTYYIKNSGQFKYIITDLEERSWRSRKNGIEDKYIIHLTKITAVKNEVALNYHRVRGLYFLVVIFAATIYITIYKYNIFYQ